MSVETGYVLAIQSDWNESFRNEDESVWVYHKVRGQRSHHGSIGGRTSESSFKIDSKENRSVIVTHLSTGHRIKFIAPVSIYDSVHVKGIVDIDVAHGGLGVSVSSDNKLHIWETDTGIVRRELTGHLFDVYTCRLFPSGVVALSGGADMQMRIWDAATGLCPVVLKGHTGTVMDTAIVDRGRNIVSVSKDKTTRLWNCAEAKCLKILHSAESEVNCCAITDVSQQIDLAPALEEQDELEYCTAGKVLIIGCEDGFVYMIDIASSATISSCNLKSPVMAVAWISATQAAVGLLDGRLVKVDIKISGVFHVISHDSDSSIQCLRSLPDGIVVGRHDGLCQYYTHEGFSPCQLTGPDCDPVYGISHSDSFLYTACRDGKIRKYNMWDLNIS